MNNPLKSVNPVENANHQTGAAEDKNLQAAETQKDSSSEGKLSSWVKGLLRGSKPRNDDSLRDAIGELIEGEEGQPQSAVAAHERRLIANILELRDLPVLDVMVPRADIVAINASAGKEALMELLSQKPHSRIPVYKDDLDNIIGVINMKDLVANLATGTPFEIKDVMREALVVSPAMRVMDMLLQMRQSKVHIAFVVDEFGGIDGLVTINDLISAIVGEIDDEFDFDITPQMIERPDGSIIADARFAIESFEELYGNVFSEDDDHEEIDTLGGLVTYLAGHVPARGEIIRHEGGIEFEVVDADPRRIMRLRIRNLPKKIDKAAEE
jgi:CBS domain containing-hemolysin-like protein